jgi:DNA-binding MarR family transcriptional regulator
LNKMRDMLIESVMEVQSAYADLDEKIQAALSLYDVPITSAAAIVILCMGRQVLTSTEVKRRRYYVGTNFTYNLANLKRVRLIEQSDHHIDRRKQVLQLTPEGLELAGQLREYLSGRKSERNAA